MQSPPPGMQSRPPCTQSESPNMHAQVPPGTVVRAKGAAEEDAPLAEVVHAGDRALLMTGGRGGRGNASFKSAFNKCAAPFLHC